GAAGRPDLVYAVGRSVAVEMRSLGVNVNYAPVLDVNVEPANPVIGLRSFGETPELVADLGNRYISGQQGGGVIAVAKHFPGHGRVDVDSHVALPLLDAPLDALQRVELPPFQAAVAGDVAAVMVAHLSIPAVDPGGVPSSLSPAVVDGILRDQIGFDGVVMTDDMGMSAIRDHYTLSEATVRAVLAGNDLLLAVETTRDPDVMRDALLNAVAAGRIDQSRIDASVRRLIRLKLAYDLAAPPATTLLENGPAHEELAREAGAAAVTPIRDNAGLLPLPLPSRRLLLVSPAAINPGTAVGDGKSLLHEIIAARGVTVEELFYNPQDPADVARAQTDALSRATTADAVVVVTWDANLRYVHHGETAQETLVNRLLDGDRPVVVVFGRLPYDHLRVPDAPTQIALFGDTAGQLEGLTSLLLGPSPLTNSRN
ncbi:MAG: glycoside hydrolase family 3 N-terminal domain-containing protein, partial [Candidatus Promineifilaceae bacterium]|nr:glycoside hydrolase family 3 N-terminal domain-containing protein [Candidatus Promineifilaceae bacterium]